MTDISTGPALDQNELAELADLMRHPRWPVFQEYLDRLKKAANVNLMKRNRGLEENGYWKGVVQLAEDLINLREGLGKQLFAESRQTDGGQEKEEKP